MGLIFTVGMLFMLTSLISETENTKKAWDDMTCQQLENSLSSNEYNKLSKDDNAKFQKALELCKEG